MNWTTTKLGDVATFINGYAFKPSDWSDSGLEIIRIQNLTKSSKEVNYFKGEIDQKYKVKNGDLLISWSATLGIYEWLGDDCWLNQHIFKVDFNKVDIDKSFFHHLIKILLSKLDQEVHGSTMKHITKKRFDDLDLQLPPLKTQQKIASILDKADELRQYNKQLLEKYDALTQSLFLDMFGDPVRNEKGWDKKELREFGKIITGSTPPRLDDENYSSNFIEWLKTDNIKDVHINVTQSKEYLSEKGFTKARFVEKGALLVACIAGSIDSIGRAALTDRKVSFNQQINAIQPFGDVNSAYLHILFRISRKYIQKHASKGMKRMLTKGEFEKIFMIKPPINLQNQFAQRIKLIETQKQQAQEALAKSEALFQGLLQQAFKGELI